MTDRPPPASSLAMLLSPSSSGRRVVPASVTLVIVVLGFAIRLAAARGELWLDEIWSLKLAGQVHSPLDLLLRLRHDNNHVLNTAYLSLLGPGYTAIMYRLPHVLAGAATAWLAGYLASRWGRIESLTTMTLVATSYLLVHYSSEARGYAFVLLFALAAWESLLRVIESSERNLVRQAGSTRIAAAVWESPALWTGLFWASCLAGLLSHPIFVHFWMAAACWSLLVFSRIDGTPLRALPRVMGCHAVPLVAAVSLYLGFWRAMEWGGGPPYSSWAVVAETASRTAGGPGFGIGAWFVAGECLAFASIGVWLSRRNRWNVGLLLAFGMGLPLLQVGIARPPFLFVRYFLVAVLFATFAIAVALSKLYRRGRWGRWAYAGTLISLIAANSWHTLELARLGRGQCLAALHFMHQATGGSTLTISRTTISESGS